MKIDGTNAIPEGQPAKLQRGGSSGAEEVRETPGAQDVDDATTLASSQRTTGQLAAHLNALPDVRQERIAAVRQAIQSGQFNPSDQQIADAIHAQLLGSRSTGNH